MARVKPEQPLVPSVLDRLLDDDPAVTAEPPRSRSQVLRELKLAVQRDLRNLLNTRARCRHRPPELTELDQSLVTYGITDFTSGNLASPDNRLALCRSLEEVIRTFLPAFQAVTVRVRDGGDGEPLDGTLRFQIDALLRVHPAPEPVAFAPQLELDTGTFTFEEPAS